MAKLSDVTKEIENMSGEDANETDINAVMTSVMKMQNTAIQANNKSMIKQTNATMQSMKDMVSSSMALDEEARKKYINLIEASTKRDSGIMKKLVSESGSGMNALKAMIPSSDMIIGAVAASSPAMAMGLNIIKKFGEFQSEKRSADAAESAKRVSALEAEGEALRNATAAAAKGVESEPPIINIDSPEPDPVPETTMAAPELNMDSLGAMSGTNDELARQTNIMLDQSDALVSMMVAMEEGVKLDAKRLESENRARIRALGADEPVGAGVTVSPLAQSEGGAAEADKQGGKLSGILSMVTGKFGSIIKYGTSFVSTFVGFFGKVAPLVGKIGTLARGIGRFAGPIAGVIALVMAAKDFLGGFMNAEEILNVENATISDRVSAGVGSILGGIAGMFDMVAGMFGADTDLKGKVTEITSNFFKNYFDGIKGLYNSVVTWLYDGVKTMLSKLPMGDKLADKIGVPKLLTISKRKEDEIDEISKTAKPQRRQSSAVQLRENTEGLKNKKTENDREKEKNTGNVVVSTANNTNVNNNTTQQFSRVTTGNSDYSFNNMKI